MKATKLKATKLKPTVLGVIRLTRPANLVTAVADILAGIALSGWLSSAPGPALAGWQPLLLLVACTLGLYGGGVMFNDVFDRELDRVERPERPIPSGLVSARQASAVAAFLLLAAIALAALVHPGQPLSVTTLLAAATALAALVYDKWGKHQSLLGPINMGLCRGLNLLLGISIVPAMVGQLWWLALVPVVYIAAITMISRGEVHGGRSVILWFAALLYLLVMAAILGFAASRQQLLPAAILVALFAALVFPPLLQAIRQPAGPRIGKAVKYGVLALIVMNAAWVAATGNIGFAVLVLALLPLSILLAKLFAVT